METYRALLVVDAEKFSAHRDAELRAVHLEVRYVLAVACADSGLGEAWRNVRFMESTGDGILAALPHESIPALVDLFPPYLQDALAESGARLPPSRKHGSHPPLPVRQEFAPQVRADVAARRGTGEMKLERRTSAATHH